MQEDNHIFQGLKRDSHQIRQDAKFLWDAHNIRLTNRDNSTLFSITNERGTDDTGVALKGYYVGHCVINKYLIVFTSADDSSDNYIYRIEDTNNGYNVVILFHESEIWDKGWSPYNPIETIGVYETNLVQKVYWIDGVNQPRVINIAKPELKIPHNYIVDGVDFQDPNNNQNQELIDYLNTNFPNGLYLKDSFDFVRELSLNETVRVEKIYGQGEFSPGTVQYAFSYYDKYMQESNIWYTTQLYYTSFDDRGANPEDKVPNAFRIEIDNPDPKFEYLRIYSIHRTSIDAVPTVKVVEDVLVSSQSNNTLSYVDTGINGHTIDPTQLLYIGGTPIVSNCMAQKDRTLFFGNITQEDTNVLKRVEELLKSGYEIDDWYIESDYKGAGDKSTFYEYSPDLSKYNGGFMPDESYRCGIQVQYNNGKWSDPIWVGDLKLCDNNAWNTPGNRESKAVRILYDSNKYNELKECGVRRFRTCIVFPKAAERNVICQGVLCPTVFGVSNRRINSPYAMSSWFFRPATDLAHLSKDENDADPYKGASIQFQHNKALFSADNRGAEIQSMLPGIETVNDLFSKESADDNASHFFVDENIVTFHSPDLEFDPYLVNYNWDNVYLRIIGIAKLGAISGDIDIQTSTPTAGSYASGFIKTPIGYQTKSNSYVNGGLVMGTFYNDIAIEKDSYKAAYSKRCYAVYPWHRSGSLNNDARRPLDKGTQSAILSKKKISNLKFFDENVSLGEDIDGNSIGYLSYNISKPQIFNSEELDVIRLSPYHLRRDITYLGNIDTLVTVSRRTNENEVSANDYKIYYADSFVTPISNTSADIDSASIIMTSRDPVRIKYKSSPHLVFSLDKKVGYSTSDNNIIPITLLPRSKSIGSTLNGGEFKFPDWDDTVTSTEDGIPYYVGVVSRYKAGSVTGTTPWEADMGNFTISRLDGQFWLHRASYDPQFGKSYKKYTGNKGESVVVKISTNFTKRYPEDVVIPGTSSSDYNEYTYTGSNLYYKCTFIYNDSNAIDFEKLEINKSEETTEEPIKYIFNQATFGNKEDRSRALPHLLIGELVRDGIINKFGGTSEEALKQNLWLPASNPINLSQQDIEGGLDIVVPFEFGDTWYSRYDCLKTYPYTQEDENSVIEIGSFMCETRVNIDGRYDRNRGQLSNINMNNTNFNLINEVYFQKDNFFNYRILDKDLYKNNVFPNQLTWSKEKTVGEDVDSWSNITLASTLDMNGEMGSITSLETWNEYLLCFQDKAISQVSFNSRVAVSTSDGVPIEISNNYKVDGSKPISNNIGCNNKWSIVNTESGIYFMDSYNNNIYIFNGNLTNLSRTNSLDWWSKRVYTDESWKPIWFSENKVNGVRSFYDNKYGDVYITPGPSWGRNSKQEDALCYSNSLGQFTSLMSYGGVQAMFNYSTDFYSLRTEDYDGHSTITKLYKNNSGDYNNFFGEIKGWDFSFISNQNPTITKIFDTIDLRADCYLANDTNILSHCPINYINISNEYQSTGDIAVNKDIDRDKANNNFRKKFRIWRGSIPRASKVALPYNSHIYQDGVDTNRKYGRSRIRNPWAMITLGWSPDNSNSTNERSEIHDVSVNYTV